MVFFWFLGFEGPFKFYLMSSMAPDNNWLSFSLSSMEMLSSSASQSNSMLQSNMKLAPTFDGSSSADSHHYYFADNFFPHGKFAFLSVLFHFCSKIVVISETVSLTKADVWSVYTLLFSNNIFGIILGCCRSWKIIELYTMICWAKTTNPD